MNSIFHKLREVSEEVREVKTSFKKNLGAVCCYKCGNLQLNCPQKHLKKVEDCLEAAGFFGTIGSMVYWMTGMQVNASVGMKG